MALPAHFDDEFDFEGRLDGKHFSIGYKRSTPAYDDEDYDEPRLVITYLQALKSSEDSLTEQLEKTKKKKAAFIVNICKTGTRHGRVEGKEFVSGSVYSRRVHRLKDERISKESCITGIPEYRTQKLN
ncbi:hypothetical protein L6164_014946 [Bauhinia variegata]|uniref:Uncharacterized protein n=1 Tax=Bauhinia variegata TaxID=167791 RepID=A0ACB9NKC2_BAUVA|nr:hypothetical protein L6164_014946 [Bauhinia variegata]